MSFLVFVSISGNGSAASEIEWNDEHVGGGGLRRKNCGEETFDEDFRPAMIETASRGSKNIWRERRREGGSSVYTRVAERFGTKGGNAKKKKKKNEEGEVEERRGGGGGGE